MGTWTLYRHYTDSKYHGQLAEIEAENSEEAVKAALELLTDGNHRALIADEVIALTTPTATGAPGAIHLFRIEPQMPVAVRI